MRRYILSCLILALMAVHCVAQEDVLDDVSTALRAGSAKELVKFCTSSIRIQINDETNTYTRPHAEAILREFFQNNTAEDFQITHKGTASNGYVYRIGRYTLLDGSYRVYLLFKEENERYLIYTISFSKE